MSAKKKIKEREEKAHASVHYPGPEPDREKLFERIMSIRDAIGPVNVDVCEVLRELRGYDN